MRARPEGRHVADVGAPIEGPGDVFAVALPLVLLALGLGLLVGAAVCGLLALSNALVRLIWVEGSAAAGVAWYPVAVGTAGGLAIGLWTRFGYEAPESLAQVMAKVRATGGYEVRSLPRSVVSFLLPLAFGGSVGPEAGLSGIVAAACTRLGNRLRHAGVRAKSVADLSLSATLTAVFGAPFLGIVATAEDVLAPGGTRPAGDAAAEGPARTAAGDGGAAADGRTATSGGRAATARTAAPEEGTTPAGGEAALPTFRRPAKVVLYGAAAFGAFAGMQLVALLPGANAGLPRYDSIDAQAGDLAWLIPLVLAGWALALLFHVGERVGGRIRERLGSHVVALPVACGAVLGLVALALPGVMFSGEEQARDLLGTWGETGAALLLATGAAKALATPLCLGMGWRGGHFFPLIFSGLSVGFGMAALTGGDPMLCVTVTTTVLMAGVMRRPLLAMALLLLCFPADGLLWMSLAAFAGAALPVPGGSAEGPAHARRPGASG